MFRRPLFVLVAVLAVATLGAIAFAGDKEHSCMSASCTMEKIDTGLRCTAKPMEGVTLAAMREHITGCSAKRFPEGVTTTFEEKDGVLIVTHSATDPEAVKKLHAMADAKGEGTGCKHHEHGAETAKAGCPHHAAKTAEASAETPKAGCKHHQHGAEGAAVAEAKEHSCPSTGCSMEKTDTGLRCTAKPKEGVTLAALREHVTGCCAKRFPEGVTTTFEEKDGALIVTHTATDAEAVKKLHEMADAKGEGCMHHAADAPKAGCPHHKNAEAKGCCPKDGKGCCPKHKAA